MKPRNAVVATAAAVVLGSLTGLFLLPDLTQTTDGAAPQSAVPSPATSTSDPTPTPSPSASATPSPTPAPTRPSSDTVGEDTLLPVSAFADQSVEVTYDTTRRGMLDPGADVSPCLAGDAYQGRSTLKEITGYDPSVQGLWGETTTDDTADEVVAVAADAASASESVRRLIEAVAPCQKVAKAHWVYGPVHTLNTTSEESSSWIGYFPGEQNKTGQAPTDVEPCGGLLLARNGSRFALLQVFMCLDQVQLAGLAQSAAVALG